MEIIKTREHDTVAISSDLILREGRLNLYPDLPADRLFKLSLRPAGVMIQPAGYIGFVPLNDMVAIEVAPRIPVANVEYLLAKSGLTPEITLAHIRAFGETNEAPAPFLMLLATRFVSLIHELRFEGLFKSYVPQRYVGRSPSGRLFPMATALHSQTSGRAVAVFERFDRTMDNPINQLILAAGRKLLESSLIKGSEANTRLARSIRQSLYPFSQVSRVTEPTMPDQAKLPANRPFLRQLVAVSGVILREQGVRLRGEGRLRLPTFLIQMDKVFEAYVRKTLQASNLLQDAEVLDGNLKSPAGAQTSLFTDPGPLGNHDLSPDIVLSDAGKPASIIEIKYKPCPKKPDRDHIEQMLTYAIGYNVKRAALLYPAVEGQNTAITLIGIVNGIECYKVTFDLSTDDMGDSEKEVCRAISHKLLTERQRDAAIA